MSSELIELVEFLHSPQPAVRQIALENLAQFSQGQHAYIFKNEDLQPIKDLKLLLREKADRTRQLALTILINLCDDVTILDFLASDEVLLEYIANSITDLTEVNANLFCMLLANLAKNDNTTKLFEKKRKIPAERSDLDKETFKSDHIIDCLMDCFVKGSERTLNKAATYDLLAFFFSDISRFKEGRKYFVTEQKYDGVVPITKLLVFTESESRIRRAGVASTIKNSLFEVSCHESLVMDPEVNLLLYLLLPLAGPEEIPEDEMFNLPEELQLLPPDKKREADHQILSTHVESLLILSTTRPIREHMREKSVYSIIRELHLAIDDEDVQDPCDRLVQVLMRDETGDEPEAKIEEMAEDSDEEVVEVL